MSINPAITAQDVADYFLFLVDDPSGDNLSNLKLQKLVYYAQGFYLAIHDRPLFDDAICAWEHGPVVPSLYRRYKKYGSGGIPAPIRSTRPCSMTTRERCWTTSTMSMVNTRRRSSAR